MALRTYVNKVSLPVKIQAQPLLSSCRTYSGISITSLWGVSPISHHSSLQNRDRSYRCCNYVTVVPFHVVNDVSLRGRARAFHLAQRTREQARTWVKVYGANDYPARSEKAVKRSTEQEKKLKGTMKK